MKKNRNLVGAWWGVGFVFCCLASGADASTGCARDTRASAAAFSETTLAYTPDQARRAHDVRRILQLEGRFQQVTEGERLLLWRRYSNQTLADRRVRAVMLSNSSGEDVGFMASFHPTDLSMAIRVETLVASPESRAAVYQHFLRGLVIASPELTISIPAGLICPETDHALLGSLQFRQEGVSWIRGISVARLEDDPLEVEPSYPEPNVQRRQRRSQSFALPVQRQYLPLRHDGLGLFRSLNRDTKSAVLKELLQQGGAHLIEESVLTNVLSMDLEFAVKTEGGKPIVVAGFHRNGRGNPVFDLVAWLGGKPTENLRSIANFFEGLLELSPQAEIWLPDSYSPNDFGALGFFPDFHGSFHGIPRTRLKRH